MPFFSRLFYAWVVYFRVLFDGEYAALLQAGGPKALPEPEKRPEPEKKEEKKAEPKGPPPPPPTDAALQLLALLQREGRLVDFLEEDVASFADADIGAAARVVHAGCRKALREHVKLAPVRAEEEGSKVTLPESFDPAQVKLTGNVQGKGPYAGTLRHRGWRAEEITLPTAVEGHDPHVLAQAEVEL
ncbi:MAG: DUF2760 domain-containing protein [Deltaproteobacteria bacterium]|nr:DUF2760 domain-containing protein [Deltaproteobacteria bacterium]